MGLGCPCCEDRKFGKPLRKLPAGSNFEMCGECQAEVDGKPIGRNEDLICAIEEAEPGSAVSLKVVRNCDPERLEELRFTPVMRKTLAERR